MKKLLLLLISFSFIGCSSIEVGGVLSSLELEDALSSEDEAQRILALGLTHEENLLEASKLSTPHLVSVVSLKLTNARDEKIQYEIDLIESEKLTELAIVSNNGLSIIGSKVSESKKTGVLETDFDLQSYYLEGLKDSSSGNISHKLYLNVVHNSKNRRDYNSVNYCDKWGRCDENEQIISVIPATAANCSSLTCDYSESMSLELTDDFLKDNIDRGFTMRFNSKKKNNKIEVSRAYIIGYLKAFESKN